MEMSSLGTVAAGGYKH